MEVLAAVVSGEKEMLLSDEVNANENGEWRMVRGKICEGGKR